MKLSIDNLDGKGSLDYSARLCPDAPIIIERELNTPSHCSCALNLYDCPLRIPARNSRIKLQSDTGTLLFTGYISINPELTFVGSGVLGSAYRVLVRAVSDDWILDRDGTPLRAYALSQPVGQMLRMLTQEVAGSGLVSTLGIPDGRSIGFLQGNEVKGWSGNAKLLASSTCSSYRVLDAQAGLSSAGKSIHSFDEADDSLQKQHLNYSSTKQLANDVTVSGDVEPASYVAQYFMGDGSTSLFDLAEAPFHASGRGTDSLLEDSFDQENFDPRLWTVLDSGSHLSITGAGLTMNGGTGVDGQTVLAASNPIELGGSQIFEADEVQLGQLSVGILCGLYLGSPTKANCVTGYSVRQLAGSTTMTPLVNGIEVGTSFSLVSGLRYSFRIRMHCPEMHRVKQAYYTTAAADTAFGGGLITAPLQVVFEVRDLGKASNTPAVILYDGAIQSSPAIATYVAVNSTQMYGSIGSCSIRQSGSVWVTSTLISGDRFTRLIGLATEGDDCTLSSSGRITFLPGRIPAAGEIIEVTYRSKKRSVSRVANAASIAQDIASGLRGPARWVGEVLHPPARSSEDCESAADALLTCSTDLAAAVSGNYQTQVPEDVWPGDSVQFSSDAQSLDSIVRRVTIFSQHSLPEVLTYSLEFAGEWAEPLGITTSEKIAADAALPQRATFGVVKVLANLQRLRLISVDGMSLQIDAGVDPPEGGGFEVRRRESGFGSTSGTDFVLQSAVRSFSIPREAAVERYFVRMYDGSTPPVYSRFASAVFMDLPVG